MKRIDYSQIQTEYLTAIKYDKHVKGRVHWLFQCICGNKKSIDANRVYHRRIKSCGCYSSRHKAKSFESKIYRTYKINARKRDIYFYLTKKDVELLTKQDCYYCGIRPFTQYLTFVNEYNRPSNGIDRKNNNLGYDIDNCVSCCSTCNFMKNTLSEQDFIKQAIRITKNNTKSV